jgi:hypothetical protein
MPVLGGRGEWFCEGLQKIWSNNTFFFSFFWCFTVSIGGKMGRSVPMVMMMERGNATDVLVFFKY